MSFQCLLLLSSQCSFFCHPSSPFFVIPVPRHWDPEKLIVIPNLNGN
ncbi:MAG: hypothetical protein ACEY3L_19960 [Wolbachia sp.]